MAKLVPTLPKITFNNTDGFAYSFWFRVEALAGTGGDIILLNNVNSGQFSNVYFRGTLASIRFRSHGNVTSADGWYDSTIISPEGTSGFIVNYELKKLNNILFLKKSATSMECYVNGQLACYNTNTVSYYPDASSGFIGINPNHNVVADIGDMAYWDEDISDIASEIYNGGVYRNWMLLSKQPKHYWRLGDSTGSSTINDIGTDGTNHFAITAPTISRNYTLDSGDGTNYVFTGDAVGADPDITVVVGDTLNFSNTTGGHVFAIKNANNIDVANESSNLTIWTPEAAGEYTYYCVSHPTTMFGKITVVDVANYSQTVVLSSSSGSSSSGSDDPATVAANIISNPENVLGQTEADGSITSLNNAFGSDFDSVTVTPVTSLSTEELEVVAASSSVSNSLSSKTDIFTFGTDAGSYRTESANFKDNLSPVIMITADIGFIIKDLSESRNYGTQFIFQSTGESEIILSAGSMSITFADADNLSVSNILEILAGYLNDTWSFALVKLEVEEVAVSDSGTAFGDLTGSITLNGFTNSGPTNITGDIVTDISTINQNTSSSTSIDAGSSLMQNPADALFKIYKQLDDGPSYHNISPGWTIQGNGAYSIGVHLDKDHVIIFSSETGDATSAGGSISHSSTIYDNSSSNAIYIGIDKAKNPTGVLADIKSLYQAQSGGATNKWSYAILKVTSVS
jgi:plastocyanin